MYIKNFFFHFCKIWKHKYYVFKNCCKLGIPFQGLVHDLSKFSPVEFLESVKYYQGTSSPIDACKKEKGYSNAWLHHKGRNRHHYEYWQDNFDNGGTPLLMPFDCALEMFADCIGAAQAYLGKDFSFEKEWSWWLNKKAKGIAMHPAILGFMTDAMYFCKRFKKMPNKGTLKIFYNINVKDGKPYYSELIK